MGVGDTFIPSLSFWMENAIQAQKHNVCYWETNKTREVEAQIAAHLYRVQHGSYLHEFDGGLSRNVTKLQHNPMDIVSSKPKEPFGEKSGQYQDKSTVKDTVHLD